MCSGRAQRKHVLPSFSQVELSGASSGVATELLSSSGMFKLSLGSYLSSEDGQGDTQILFVVTYALPRMMYVRGLACLFPR